MLPHRHRILIAVSKAREGELKTLFEREPLGSWEPLFADGFSRARYILQHNPCDALVVHEDLLDTDSPQGLAWLVWRRDYPVVFLGHNPSHFRRAYELGVQHCLNYEMALTSAPLMSTVLNQARLALDNAVKLDRTRDQLGNTRRHIDRLVTLMWRTSPRHGDSQWYSEPFLVERLTEELARAERYKLPLSLAIGEVKAPKRPDSEFPDSELPDWTADLLVKGKRRCDVVGQYGTNGFLVLMMQTPKAGGISCCKRLQNVIEEHNERPRPSLQAYFGLTSTLGEHSSVQSMLRSAEQNLEAARHEPTMRIVGD
jgi:diguanylate cyclase (GGDEF)-like protein